MAAPVISIGKCDLTKLIMEEQIQVWIVQSAAGNAGKSRQRMGTA